MAVSINEALDIIYKNISPVSIEVIPIELSLGRILAKDCIASFAMPRFDNSTRDGFAVKCADAGKTVLATDVIYAGDKPDMTLQRGEAIRIMTGAPVPHGCEAVVPFELVAENDKEITLPDTIEDQMFIRYAGEDIKRNMVYLHQGDKVTAYSIALLASQGITHVSVYRKVKVTVFSSGDELCCHYEQIESHQLYNSNTPMFLSRARELGGEVSFLQNIGDTVEQLEEAIRDSLNAAIIITSGGMNFGDKDFTKEAFANCGLTSLFNRVNIKPGRPVAFGTIGHTAIINLPGNPLAGMVNFEVFIRTVIHKMSGTSAYYINSINTVIAEPYTQQQGQYTVVLGHFDGESFTPLKKQMAGMVAPMQKTEAMLITDENTLSLGKGEKVKIIPVSWEFFAKHKKDFYT
jgi:molybdopterin molybdotransferase